MIEVKNLGKNYGSCKAVKGVGFNVHNGEIVGLLGPNGAGKTTIMKILTGYLYPTFGTVMIDSKDVVDHANTIKAMIGYLPENSPLYTDLNVYEYLNFVADARHLVNEQRKERIQWVIDECGLKSVLYKNISELSKGFKQRAGLAQAMIHDPKILILDEPTTGLDPNQILDIRDLIKRMGKEKTTIISTHILQEVEAICNRVLILNEGEIVAQGTTEEIGKELKGEELLHLTLKVEDTGSVKQELVNCNNIEKVLVYEEQDKHRLKLKLSLKSHKDALEGIFDWTVSKGYKILAMVPEKISLEDIFIKLTREGGDNAR
ncbi:MAG: ATP-binding cassette domain-containing protein [Spirochaetales bacterium]|nr:ATP-binding cassette domain-containing protein [Spirochaetales bacterium]